MKVLPIVFHRWFSSLLPLSIFTLSASSQAAPTPDPALTNWISAYLSYRQAGALIANGEYKSAQNELARGSTNLALSYARLSKSLSTALESVFNQPLTNESDRLTALSDFCMRLHAYKEAAELRDRAVKETKKEGEDPPEDELRGWRLVELGKLDEAIVAYKELLAKGHVSTIAEYYTNQIELLERRKKSPADVGLSLQFVREHYLKGYEEKGDLFCSLQELTRVLPLAKAPAERLSVYKLIVQCLGSLGDAEGRDAWEDKQLSESKVDENGVAEVLVNRGIRAYLSKDYARAAKYFRKVCQDFPNSESYGDAQYNLGSTLQDQKDYGAAIEEFSRLFTSNVNDYKLTPGTSEDYKLYRHKAALRISECYEATKAYAKALEYAELARTRYRPLSWCSNCLKTAQKQLDARIERLEHALQADRNSAP